MNSEAKRRLRQIELLAEDPNITIKLLKDCILRFCKDFNFRPLIFSRKKSSLFRAHHLKIDKYPDVDAVIKEFSNPGRFSCAPANLVTEIGRCNNVNQSIFYCSNENTIPIHEVRPVKDSFIVEAVFSPIGDKDVNLYLPIIGFEKILASEGKRDPDSPNHKILKQQREEERAQNDLNLEIDDYLSNWFLKPVNEENPYHYKLTAALSYVLIYWSMYEKSEVRPNGIMYPSVAGDYSGINWALDPDFIKNNFEFNVASLFKVHDVKENKEITVSTEKVCFRQFGPHIWESPRVKTDLFTFNPNTPVSYFDQNLTPKLRDFNFNS